MCNRKIKTLIIFLINVCKLMLSKLFLNYIYNSCYLIDYEEVGDLNLSFNNFTLNFILAMLQKSQL